MFVFIDGTAINTKLVWCVCPAEKIIKLEIYKGFTAIFSPDGTYVLTKAMVDDVVAEMQLADAPA